MGWIPGLGRSAGGGHGNPLQDSYLENPMDRGAWQATVHRVAESDTTEATEHTCKAYKIDGVHCIISRCQTKVTEWSSRILYR